MGRIITSKRLRNGFSQIPYDEILQLLDELESGEAERKYSLSQLDRINSYLITLCKEGLLSNEFAEEDALQEDVYDLVYGEDSVYQLRFLKKGEDSAISLIFTKSVEDQFLPCGKISHAWKKTKKFVKKHKKEIIIGAVVVVAVAAVTVAVVVASSSAATSAASAAAAGVAASGGSGSSKSQSNGRSSSAPSGSQPQTSCNDIPIFKSAMDEQISSFKENLAKENFFPTNPSIQGLSLEETGRAIGPIFAHDSFNQFNNHLLNSPQFSQEVQSITSEYNFSIPPGGSDNPVGFAHKEIAKRFASGYGPIFSDSAQEGNFNALSYQARGEAASFYGYHNQAIHDFSKAIELNPKDPNLYLQRGISHFNNEQYENAIEDFRSYVAQSEPVPQKEQFNLSEFTIGFVEGLPQGIYKGGKDVLLFAYDGITQPIHTAKELFNACSVLATYVKTNEWEAIGKTLSPELHKVITEWDYIPSRELGNLISSSIGEFGSQFLVPMAGGKLILKGVKGAKEVTYVLKTIGRAEEIILLEAAAEIGNGAKFGEIVNASKSTLFLGEELGFTAKEMGQLKQAGKLEKTVSNSYEILKKDPIIGPRITLLENAEKTLYPLSKEFFPESIARQHIHSTGIKTFPRPKVVPENYLVRITDRGAGMEYMHPTNTHISVRVMPGKPHSPHINQQKPYVIQKKDGKAFDKHGNLVGQKTPEAHIPIEEFIYRE